MSVLDEYNEAVDHWPRHLSFHAITWGEASVPLHELNWSAHLLGGCDVYAAFMPVLQALFWSTTDETKAQIVNILRHLHDDREFLLRQLETFRKMIAQLEHGLSDSQIELDIANRLIHDLKDTAVMRTEAAVRDRREIQNYVSKVKELHATIAAIEFAKRITRDKLFGFTKPMRLAAFGMTEYHCMMCEQKTPLEELEAEHMWPRSRGGAACWRNLGVVCKSCNASKKDRIGSALDYIYKERWQLYHEACQALEERYGCPAHGETIELQQLAFRYYACSDYSAPLPFEPPRGPG